MPIPLIAAAGVAARAVAPAAIKQIALRVGVQSVAGAMDGGSKPQNNNLQQAQFQSYQHPDGIV